MSLVSVFNVAFNLSVPGTVVTMKYDIGFGYSLFRRRCRSSDDRIKNCLQIPARYLLFES